MKNIKLFLVFLSTIFVAMAFSINANAQITGGGNSEFVAEYTYDFAKHGGSVGFKSLKGAGSNALPSNAVVLSGYYQVLTALTSAGNPTLAIGDAAAGGKYLAATAYNNAAFDANVPKAIAIGFPGLVSSANIANVGVTIASTDVTAGKIRIVLQGHIPKKQ